jgi:hypothetical protein
MLANQYLEERFYFWAKVTLSGPNKYLLRRFVGEGLTHTRFELVAFGFI